MASIYANADQQSYPVVADNAQVQARSLRSGELVTAPWIQSLILDGRCYMIQVGALTTPIVGGGNGDVVDLDQPEVNIGVPSGTSILPFRIDVQVENNATEADNAITEIIIGMDRTATNTGGTFTDEDAVNLRTDNPRSSLCDPNSAYTANQTVAPTVIELARLARVPLVDGSSVARADTSMHLVYEPTYIPVIVGPAQLLVYWGGVAAVSGYAQVYWAELPTLARVS